MSKPLPNPAIKISQTRRNRYDLTPKQLSFCFSYICGPPAIRTSAQACYATAYGWLNGGVRWEDLSEFRRWKARDYGNKLMHKPKIQKYIEVLRHQQELEMDQTRGSYLQRSIEMREMFLDRGSDAAAARMQRDIGEVLGHYTTRIEISEAPQSGDIISQIGELIKTHPELQRLAISMIAESASALKMLDEVTNHPQPIPVESIVRDVTPDTQEAETTEPPPTQEAPDDG